MATQKPRISNTNLTVDAPLVFYENSPEAADLNPSFVRLIAGNVVGPFFGGFLGSDDLGTGEPDPEPEDPGDQPDDPSGKTSPELSDIQLISNEVVYDAAGIPTAKIVFKVKNSSEQEVKSMNIKVQTV